MEPQAGPGIEPAAPTAKGRGLEAIRRVEGWFVAVNRAAIILLFAAMFALVFTNVVTRYLFRFSLSWAEEIASYLLVWLAYLGTGLAMREGRHVAVTLIERVLPQRAVPYVRFAVALVIMAFLAVVGLVGFRYAQFAWSQKTPVLRAPLGAVYLAVPIGSLVFLVHFLAAVREFVTARSPQDEPQEGAGE